MSHDTWASFATQELALHFGAHPNDCFATVPLPAAISVFAGGRGKFWPHEDGAIVIEHGTNKYNIAVEFKRQNEGLHGILTGLGQSLSYVNKGYAGAVLVIPKSYSSHSRPGDYIAGVINNTVTGYAVGVFSYDEPDLSTPRPFAGRLSLNRGIQIDTTPLITSGSILGSIETQWMHVREGSSTPDAFFRYLQTAKIYTTGTHPAYSPSIPRELVNAVRRIKPSIPAIRYLSYTTAAGTDFHDDVWRRFWFGYIATPEMLRIWNKAGSTYEVNATPSKIYQADGLNLSKFFGGKSNSIKNRLVALLNSGTISESRAWEIFAENVHDRAHSFREDIDSGLEAIGLLESDGKPTELGYRFVDSCERVGSAYSATPTAILTSSLLKNGGFAALLHYIYRLSEEKFRHNALEFTSAGGFNSSDYMIWLESELATSLRVIRKVSTRGGAARKPLQAELTILGKFDLIAERSKRFRTGVGLVINWPKVQEAMEFSI